MSQSIPARSTGVSLIELMVALAITALLLLGVSEIFLGSRATFTVQQAMSRSQENARFAFNYFEDSVRMAGYFGCGNGSDSALISTNVSGFWNHILANPDTDDPQSIVNFHRPIEGFDYTACDGTSCDTDGNQPAVGAAGEWSPSLADSGIPLSGSANPVKGSDVLVLRILSAESAPVIGSMSLPSGGQQAMFAVGPVSGDPDFIKPYGVYASTNCAPRVDLFIASPSSSNTSLVSAGDVNLLRTPDSTAAGPWANTGAQVGYIVSNPNIPSGTLISEIHRAEYMAFFVGLDAAGNPALRMQHYSGTMNGALPGLTVEDLADGVEAMQVLYGIDTNGDGLADNFVKASDVAAGAVTPADIDAKWREVVSVRVGLLMRGQDIAGVPANSTGNAYTVEDAVMTRPADGRYRDVYETTIALRNRLTSF